MKTIHRAQGAVAAVASLVLCGSAATALETKPVLTLDLAKKMAAACEAKARQENWKMNIAVVNDGANLVYFRAVQCCWIGRTESDLQQGQPEVRLLTGRRIPAPADV